MQFLSLDIGYLPKDQNGYQYILLIGNVFFKFIQVVPLKDQTAPTIVDALMKNWIYVHGTPLYLLTAEGNIRTVKNLLRSVLLHRKIQQTKWRSILPELIFALNTSESKAIKYCPFEVVFGRQAVLPQDILFEAETNDKHDHVPVRNYGSEVSSVLQDTFNQVIKSLQLNQQKMQQQYNKGL